LSGAGTVGAGASAINDAIYQRAQAVTGSYFTILHSGTGLTGTYPDLVTDATAGGHVRLTAGELTNDFSGSIDICAYGKTGVATANFITFSRRTGVDTISESGRFDNNGNFLVGTATGFNAAISAKARAGGVALTAQSLDGSSAILVSNTSGTANYNAMVIYNNSPFGTVVGSINCSGSTTNFNTSSDYRLKENIAPMTGALAKVVLLKPVTYKWKADGSDGQGFIAHELQAVVSDCVTGEKDGMRTEKYEVSPAIPATYDEEGGELTPSVEAVMGERQVPAYQGVDTSFLVATLTAAIQELNAKVTSLEEQVLNLGVK
jgi:hypothetical protein